MLWDFTGYQLWTSAKKDRKQIENNGSRTKGMEPQGEGQREEMYLDSYQQKLL